MDGLASNGSAPASIRKLRVRNAEQLERKRKKDREAQKERRMNAGNQMQQFESSLQQIWEKMTRLEKLIELSTLQAHSHCAEQCPSSSPSTQVLENAHGRSDLRLADTAPSFQSPSSRPHGFFLDETSIVDQETRSAANASQSFSLWQSKPDIDATPPVRLNTACHTISSVYLPGETAIPPVPSERSCGDEKNIASAEEMCISRIKKVDCSAKPSAYSFVFNSISPAAWAGSPAKRTPPTREDGLDPVGHCLCRAATHSSYAECFEDNVYQALTAQGRFRDLFPDKETIPALPELADILCLRQGTNVVTYILNDMFKKPCPQVNINVVVAGYLMSYRLLRYRFFPSPVTYDDIPEYLKPTQVQESIPHPIFIDFVPFPRLRDVLTLRLVEYNHGVFDLDILESISFEWPAAQPLLVNSENGTSLNPDFMTHTMSPNSWTLGPALFERYPRLAPLIGIPNEHSPCMV